MLSPEELQRYSRQTILDEVGVDGQQKLKQARVLIVGVGGLGSPVALYLAAAGVGTLGLVDDDTVHLSNLHRQVLFGTSDIAKPKLTAARDRLHDLNPQTKILLHPSRFTSTNAMEIIRGYDMVVDCSDSFATRYLVNDACVLAGIPDVYGSIYKFDGQVSVFGRKPGPCYRCLYPTPPSAELVPSCAVGGVLGVLPGIIGCLQATEVLKLILGIGEPLVGRMLMFDTLSIRSSEIRTPRNPNCAICGDSPTIRGLIDSDVSCDSTSMPLNMDSLELKHSISVEEYRDLRAASFEHTLVDVREVWERELADIGGMLIPLGMLTENFHLLPRDQPIVVLCHHGLRSARAASILRHAGYERVMNLDGGIAAWSERIDHEVAEY